MPFGWPHLGFGSPAMAVPSTLSLGLSSEFQSLGTFRFFWYLNSFSMPWIFYVAQTVNEFGNFSLTLHLIVPYVFGKQESWI